HVLRGRQLDQRLQVTLGRVDAAVRDEPEQVQASGVARADTRRQEHIVLGERSVFDRVVDAGQVLADDRAGAQVQMADLGVAHLALGQPDGAAAGGQLRGRVLLPELVEHRSVRLRDGVARPGRREPPTVQHDQAHRRERERAWAVRPRHGRGAAATIAVNFSASRLAPPTSAPSTSSSASSSAALSGVTLPPYWIRTWSARSPYLSRTSARMAAIPSNA